MESKKSTTSTLGLKEKLKRLKAKLTKLTEGEIDGHQTVTVGKVCFLIKMAEEEILQFEEKEEHEQGVKAIQAKYPWLKEKEPEFLLSPSATTKKPTETEEIEMGLDYFKSRLKPEFPDIDIDYLPDVKNCLQERAKKRLENFKKWHGLPLSERRFHDPLRVVRRCFLGSGWGWFIIFIFLCVLHSCDSSNRNKQKIEELERKVERMK